ncbi:nitrogen regulation protein NR(II) [Sulfuriferula sp. GW1]|uniref:two-component system sensor histidine kinase NtrB n=1 Tax=Sulfuriferula sp. GW1 TaxID=3345111 RepID=UPI0039AEE803
MNQHASNPLRTAAAIVASPSTPEPASYWRTLHYLNLYRLTLGGVFLAISLLSSDQPLLGQENPGLFFLYSIIYLGLAALAIVTIGLRKPRFEWQVSFQILTDIVLIVLMMSVSGGVRSGLGLLLIVSLVSSGLISRGRLVLLHAALATVAVLVAHTIGVLDYRESVGDFAQAGLLGVAFFTTAWIAHVLARRSHTSEQLAATRAEDLENMAQINQLVIEDMQDGVIVLDGEGNIRQANRHAVRILDLADKADEGVGQPLGGVVPALVNCLEQWRKNSQANFAALTVGRSNAQCQPRFIAVGDKRVMGAVLVLEDLSRVHQQAQQIKLAALGRLTANIAHEVRNPLSSISHAAQILQEDAMEDKTHERLLQIIHDNTKRIDRLVGDVLTLNRRDRVQPESIVLAGYLPTFVEEFCLAENIPPDSISLSVDKGKDVCFDRGHLNQVLWNLCRNAWRHSRKQPGSIGLRVNKTSASVVEIHVVDDGPGIAMENLGKLFEPFFTTDSLGTGLGLYISREMCEANRASLDYIVEKTGGHFKISCREGAC